MPFSVSVFWFRRDLRLDDNAGLYHALASGQPVLPVFIFDTNILGALGNKKDSRVHFIHDALTAIQKELVKAGSSLVVLHGTPKDCFKKLLREYSISSVYTNHDYEPFASGRDEAIKNLLNENGAGFYTYKDQVIFEKSEVVKENGEPYTIYTPYSRRWKEKVGARVPVFETKKLFGNFHKQAAQPLISLADIGFEHAPPVTVSAKLNEDIARHYDKTRDIPAMAGTTKMGVHLRFGTVSIRNLVNKAIQLNATYLNELIWREFYQMILWHFPYVVNHSFKKEYDKITWRNNEHEFSLWCAGQTGFPIVDAGMRELNETGFMHNRVRMIVASFLTKDLLVDWRWGEAYFAEKLLDYDLAANNGNWQWAAGTGCDAAPYFRIFNPELQTKKFDPGLEYIKKWVPEFEGLSYARPIVDHSHARDRCLMAYKKALGK